MFPIILFSTLDPADSLTAYNTAASIRSLRLALIWWPAALLLACSYFIFTVRYYSGKVKLSQDNQGFY